MRPIILLSVLLSVVCSPGVILHAQSCTVPDRLAGLSVTGTTCEEQDSWGDNWRCEPGDTITFTPLLQFGNAPATCPTVVDWDFGDGTTLTSSDPSVTHAYATTGRYFGKLNARFRGNGVRSFSFFIATGVIGFASPRILSVEEGQSATIAVVRTGNLSRPGTIDYRTSGPILPLSGTLAFGAGEERKDLLIEAVDDAISNGENHYARIDLSNPTEDWILESSNSNATVTVIENDLAAIHQCVQTELHVNERAEVVTFELTRSQNISGTTTGYVSISGWGSYPAGYLPANFAPGETTHVVDLRWEDDSVYHGARQWTFNCGGIGPGVSSSKSTGTLTLIDDEPYPTLIAPPSIDVTETDSPQLVAIPLTFVPPFGHLVFPDVVLEHETSNDLDLKILPFRHPYDKVELEINGDELQEADETLHVRFTGPVQKWIPLTIRDDDRPLFPYSFDKEDYEFEEELGGSVVVQRTGSLSSPVQLLLRIDPTIPGALDETIPVLLASGEASKEVPLTLDDSYFTGTRHATMSLELEGFAGATASLIVNDNETIPSLSVGDGSVREGNLNQHPTLVVQVTLTAPLGATLQLTLTPSHITTDAADFAAAPQVVTIFPGELTGIAVFDVNGDIAPESDETFNVTITTCCDGLATVARQMGTATIVNDDAAPPPPTETLYRLALGVKSLYESDGWLSIPVHRSGVISGTTRAILKLTASDERVFAPRTVSFAPNETVNDARFFIDDFWHSGDAVVKIELFDEDRILEIAFVTILDNEGSPRTSVYGGTAREGNASKTVPFTIHQYPPSGRPLILHLRARSGTAAYGDDFPPFDKIVEIPPRTSDYELAVPIRDDQLPEKTENFILDILAADGSGGGTTPFPASIEDDDTVWVESEPYVVRGALTTMTVHFANPAPSKDVIHFYADPNSLEGPLTVPVPVGASSVSFQALAKGTGDISFAIETPSFLTSTRVTKKVIIYDPHTVTLTPAALELAPGTSARIVLTIGPGSAGFSTHSGDWSIAAIQAAVAVDGKPSFLVHGINPGQTEILVKLPASVGGAIARLPVVVKEPVVPVIRKRAARH